MSRLHRCHVLTAEQVLNSPSRADGVPESMEHRRRRLAAQHMRDISYKFKMGITTWAIAVTFFNRFYARKSMKKNNTFVVACASLFLAGKVNDEARSHEHLANELIKAWFGKDNPQLLAIQAEYNALQGRTVAAVRAAGTPPSAGGSVTSAPPAPRLPAFFTSMYEAVLEAERALLYTVGFDFNVEIIHTWLARLLKRPRFKAMGLKDNTHFQQHLVGIANDLYKKDGTMLLQYPAEKIALAAFYFVFKAAKTHKNKNIPLPEPGADGRPWYVEEGLSQAECVEITTRFTDRLYNDNKAGGAGQGRKAGGGGAPSSALPAPSGAASTAMLGACESAAYSGAPTVGTVGGFGGATGGRSDLLSDGAGEHTSVPRPLGSDSHAATSGGGSKRPADGPPGGTPGSTPGTYAGGAAAPAGAAGHGQGQGQQGQGHPVKRARVEQAAAGSNEATSSAVHHPSPLGGTSQHSPACNGTAASAPGAAAPAAPAPAAPAAEDSEKEEGELEEGELS